MILYFLQAIINARLNSLVEKSRAVAQLLVVATMSPLTGEFNMYPPALKARVLARSALVGPLSV